ncbi:DUF1871 family protein [Bacillus sp. DTU_2020_1000418_1_SI_GHA_SEK_038]|uniref:DUF1871 family protein n=1 Tax=Bacillus sp. DTU_2020_1000418_1_SI_GHA_SEK_038 TaxID=3077585 RepID=UPI0028EE9E80|nr:DUF1871 family protein [Bacillus sp. DTU_2020_1000418_1_SI_GHA_SEK_038]WNS74766.1 DUF1871 family protein [Bacillus sp. DTU_2020_1000418_1_SI_GHA_SEK_038]
MQIQQVNIQLVNTINEWDPFGMGDGNYETEIADIVQAVHDIEDQNKLAMMIQSIFEFSFEKLLPLEECVEVAAKLLSIKDDGVCTI